MTYDELNMLLKSDVIPTAVKPLKTLIDASFTHLKPTDFEAFGTRLRGHPLKGTH